MYLSLCFLDICYCMFDCIFECHFPAKHECPIDVYFTIDTSETIALQESPPGALVQSIKVPGPHLTLSHFNT